MGGARGGTWVFGYGSLVSPDSLGRTLGRPVSVGVEVLEAELSGYQRRWNYGIGHVTGWWTGDDGRHQECTIVALGLVAAAELAVNGVVVQVSPDELEQLDHRERHYDRVDVTDLVRTVTPVDGGVVTYVPRPEAIERYETARTSGTAAIEQRYWDLVDGAFAALGDDRRERYHASTPPPDVPVRQVRRSVEPH